jgi:hypothetical protein
MSSAPRVRLLHHLADLVQELERAAARVLGRGDDREDVHVARREVKGAYGLVHGDRQLAIGLEVARAQHLVRGLGHGGSGAFALERREREAVGEARERGVPNVTH